MTDPPEPMNMIVQPPSGRPRRSPLWLATIGTTVLVSAFLNWTWWWGAVSAFAVVVLGDKFLPKAFTTRS
ncbi:hypothetical protein [Rhodococcus marinonascens]|uniref:hypothetical protein n=1 Tax=Rhodococcus marinonascens TaxID=38311 RepID=UPI000AB12E42|nr:hypothetical protein [Rhodococcus marinonascens]